MKTATREVLMDRTVKPISLEPVSGRLHRGCPRLHVARGVLEHHDRVIDDEARGDGQGHEGKIVEVVAAQVHDAEGTDERTGHGDSGDYGGADIAEERKDHQYHEGEGYEETDLDVPERASYGRRAVLNDRVIDGARQRGDELGKDARHPIYGLDDVGVRLSKNHHHDCRFSVDETKVPEVLDRVLHGAHVGEPNGRAGVVAHDDRLILFCAVELIVCVDLPILIRVGDLPFGTHCRGRPENAADILEADAVFVQCRRVKLDPDRRKGSAAHKHLTDAVYLGELLPHDARRRVIELCDRERIRLEGNDENRRVRGIPLSNTWAGPGGWAAGSLWPHRWQPARPGPPR